MKKKLSIELKENLLRFIVSGTSKGKIEILEFLETDYELHKVEEVDEENSNESYEKEEEKGPLDKGVLKIQEVIKDRKWSKLKKTLLYNLDDLNHMVLELPLVPDEEMEAAVRRKLIGDKVLENEDLVAFETIGDKDSKGLYGVYAQVIPKKILDKLQPLKLQGIDFEVFAMNRKNRDYTNPKENTMFLEVGETQTTVNIYYREKVSLSRKINTGIKDIYSEIENIFEVDRKEAKEINEKYGFVDTIRGSQLLDQGDPKGMELAGIYEGIFNKMERKVFQYIDYFQFRHSGESLKTLYYKSGFSDGDELGKHLKKIFFMENVFKSNHLQGIVVDKLDDELGEEWFTLLGTVESKHGAKFLGKEFKNPFKGKKNQIFLAVLIVYATSLTSWYMYYKLQEIEQIKRLQSIAVRQQNIQKELDEYNKLRNKIGKLKSEISYLDNITGKNTIFNNFLSELSYRIDTNVFLEQVSYEGNKVTLAGKAIGGSSYAEVYINELVRSLEGITKEVRLIRTTKLNDSDSVNDFLIEVTLFGGDLSGKQ